MKKKTDLQSLSFGGVAMLAAAFGAVAVGAFAIGALAIGRLSIRRLTLDRATLKSLALEDLTVLRLHAATVTVQDRLTLPGNDARRNIPG